MAEFIRPDGARFRMDTTEVTLGQYMEFQEAVDLNTAPPGPHCKAWNFKLDLPESFEAACWPRRPARVDWCDAWAYCAWAGKSLCKPQDWEQVCTNGWTTWFPYGDVFDAEQCNLGPSAGNYGGYDVTTPSGCHGIAPPYSEVAWLTGNVREWVDECVEGPDGAGWRCSIRGEPEYYGGPGTWIESCHSSAADIMISVYGVSFRCCSGPLCDPGEKEPCYEGPAGTLGVGLCEAGVHQCNADGSGWGPCTGQVLPGVETCGSAGDDDCDGLTNEDGIDCHCVPGQQVACYSAAHSTIGIGACHGGFQACNVQGNGFGPCEGEQPPSEETCASAGDEDCDGASNESGAKCVCVPGESRACYTGLQYTLGYGLCSPGIEQCLASGTGFGPCDGEILPAQESCETASDEDCDGIVNESGPGQPCPSGHVWSKAFGSSAPEQPAAIVMAGPAHVIVAGNLGSAKSGVQSAPVDFGTGLQAVMGGGENAFLAKFDLDGNTVWAKRFRGEESLSPAAIAVGADQSIYWTGEFSSTIDLGGGPLSGGGYWTPHGFVASLDASGSHAWTLSLPSSAGVRPTSIAVHPSGTILVAGNFWNNMVSGTLILTGAPATNSAETPRDLFVAAYDSSGTPLWLRRLSAGIAVDRAYVSVEPSGTILVGSTCRGQVSDGSVQLPTVSSSYDVCLFRLTQDGEPQARWLFGNPHYDTLAAMAVGADGRVHLAGSFWRYITIGGASVETDSWDLDGFLAVFDPVNPGGSWVRRIPAHESVWSAAISVAPNGAGLAWFDKYIVWYGPTGKMIGTHVAPTPGFVASGPDGSALLTAPAGGGDFGGGALQHFGMVDIALARIAGP